MVSTDVINNTKEGKLVFTSDGGEYVNITIEGESNSVPPLKLLVFTDEQIKRTYELIEEMDREEDSKL